MGPGVEWSGVEWSGVEWSGGEGRGGEWSGVEWSGWVGGDVNLKSAHAKTIGVCSLFDDFAWVRHVPPLPSSS